MSISWFRYYTIVLQNVTIGEKRATDTRDLLSLITACKSKIILIEVSTTHIHTHAITEHQLGGRKSPCWQLRITMGQ